MRVNVLALVASGLALLLMLAACGGGGQSEAGHYQAFRPQFKKDLNVFLEVARRNPQGGQELARAETRFASQLEHINSQLVSYKWSTHVQQPMRQLEKAVSAFSADLRSDAAGSATTSSIVRDAERLQLAGNRVKAALGIPVGQ
jgi:hypothetical protein